MGEGKNCSILSKLSRPLKNQSRTDLARIFFCKAVSYPDYLLDTQLIFIFRAKKISEKNPQSLSIKEIIKIYKKFFQEKSSNSASLFQNPPNLLKFLKDIMITLKKL